LQPGGRTSHRPTSNRSSSANLELTLTLNKTIPLRPRHIRDAPTPDVKEVSCCCQHLTSVLTRPSVRRDELRSPAESPRSSPDPDLEALLRSHIQQEFTFAAPDYADADAKDDVVSDQDETELRLFAAPANAAPTTLKIRLSSPGAADADPHFIVKKPRSYYFADQPTDEQLANYQASAIDGKTVLELSRQPWPACAMPWKVTSLSAAGMKKAVLVGHPPTLATLDETPHKRTRKNKKTRIALRKKKQAQLVKQEERAKQAQEKEEAEREKRTRRNREKKVKKKAKAQAAKAAGQTAETEAAAGAEAEAEGAPQQAAADSDTSMDE
jgi:outer membrane biosynthesis protein TonB